MRYNFGEMKVALAVLAVVVKDIGESLRRFAKYAPRFCADVFRDIKPAWKELGDALRRKERPRFSAKLLPLPGERNKRESDLREGVVNSAAVFFAGVGIGGMLSAFLLKQLLVYGWIAQAAALLAVVACGALVVALEIGVLYRSGAYFIGYVGERKAGEELEKYVRRSGCHVFHGFDLGEFGKGRGDIDHVVVCEHGVFSVETKALRKHPDKTTLVYTPPLPPMTRDSIGKIHVGENGPALDKRDSLEQNKNNALALREILWEKGFDAQDGGGPDKGKVLVRRVVFFPEWEVARGGDDKFEFVCGADEADKIKDFIRGAGQEYDGKRKLTDSQVEDIAAFFDENLRKDAGEFESPIETARKRG